MDSYDDILRRGFDEYREFVNPLIAQRAALAGEPIKLVRAEGGVLYDDEGHAVEDFHGTQAFGHRNPYIADAIRRYLDSDAPSWYPARVNPFAGRLAKRLCERAGHYDNAFFACTGSDAVEAALKLARALTKRPRLLGLEGAYHGCTFGSVSLMTKGYLRDPFAPFVEGAEHVPFGDVDALAKALAPGDVAAIVVEPIQGEGGVRELPAPFVEALCELTEKHGTLLVADEVQTALGRTGRGFLATASWPRRPDVVLLAKHLGGGITPISAMLTKRETFLRAYGDHFASGESHNTTMGFNALSCVAALAALDLLTDERIERVGRLGAKLKKGLSDTLARSPLFREARGAGFMQGVALNSPDHPWLSFAHFGFEDLGQKSTISPLVCHRLYRRGFFCFTCGHDWSLFRLQPRFDIPEEKLDAFVVAVAEELEYIEGLG
ncbi:aspartate aminotransferase family protein [Polyangium sp. 6x1]|uniref:aspartate aminotransferase family protein n=1 Tax=Polyangium sp. 6x1 TaxID=3042689 RepID=UPI0024832182|nr:aspartate aminotransferase family protein [Polyangium sp. 6x1]MDI1447066.1 aspartate aminotransferase family protein [Polyangium sp. 6x1]